MPSGASSTAACSSERLNDPERRLPATPRMRSVSVMGPCHPPTSGKSIVSEPRSRRPTRRFEDRPLKAREAVLAALAIPGERAVGAHRPPRDGRLMQAREQGDTEEFGQPPARLLGLSREV